MQNLAAYSFEAVVGDVSGRLEVLDQLVDEWLAYKGVETVRATDGSFVSKTGDGTGQFQRRVLESSLGSLREIELIETAYAGAMFTTSIQIASAADRVTVYASLSATPGESRIAPMGLYPRCPWVIRAMVNRFSDWKSFGKVLPGAVAFDATDAVSAKELCGVLRAGGRRFPVVVVSNDEDERVWLDLHLKVAEHLVGLAYVAVVSAESSWILTDELGPRDSCYLGAVRLYWPGATVGRSLAGINWLASRLALFGTDESGRNRFLAVLRKEIMSVAAWTITPPRILRDIRTTGEKERINALESQARDQALDSIVEENAKLTERLREAEQTIHSLNSKLVAATYAVPGRDSARDDSDEGGSDSASHIPPQPGETRFYKKIGSGGGVDALVQTKECNHKESNWKPAFKGIQAEKGLLKLEGRSDWKTLAHCSACTGGGRWRVRW
ncbi:hypothetical protein [Stagnimonas aquatica]|uniref:hypothetical protein n=1 Tax=Stagnimonas aquatica TaxID=2689987 RepID=UPI0011CD762F|nr:hypothetical protein [Stagnimonas aquatica]